MASKVWDRQKFKQKSKTKFLLKLSKINWYLSSVAMLNRVGCVESSKYWVRLEAVASKRARVTWSVASFQLTGFCVENYFSCCSVSGEECFRFSHAQNGNRAKTNKTLPIVLRRDFEGSTVIRCTLKPNSSFMSRLAVFVKKKLRRIGTWTALLSERKGIPVDSSVNLALYEIALNHSWCCDVHVFTS